MHDLAGHSLESPATMRLIDLLDDNASAINRDGVQLEFEQLVPHFFWLMTYTVETANGERGFSPELAYSKARLRV